MAMSKKPAARKAAAKKPVAKMATAKKASVKKSSVKKGGMFDPRQPGYVKPGTKVTKGSYDEVGLGKDQWMQKYPVNYDNQSDRVLRKGEKLPKGAWVNALGDVKEYNFKTGINPRAMKATKGNPKPTNANMAAGKKATATYKAKQAAAAKKKAAAIAKAKAKAATTAKKPTTGVYKRTPGGA